MLVRMSEEDPDYEGKWPEGDAMSERVLVPREPTPEMIRAGWPTAAPDWVVEALYRAMLEAAPAAPQMTDAEMIRTEAWQSITDELAHAAYLRGIEEGKRQAAAPQQAEPVAQIGWADEFGNLFPMGAWKPTQRTHHDSHKTAWRAVYLHPPADEVRLQGGLDNEELLEAWRTKVPGVEPTDSDLRAFALGVEFGDRGKRVYFDERNSARDAWRRRVEKCEALEAEVEALRADSAKLRTLLAVVPLPPETISLEFGWTILNVLQAAAIERAAQGERR